MDEEMRDLMAEQLAELTVIRSQLDATEARYKEIARKLGLAEEKKATGSNLAAGLTKTLGSVLSKATKVATGPVSVAKKTTATPAPKKSATSDSKAGLNAEVMHGLTNAAISLLLEANKAMNFEDVFAKLKNSGVEMPPEKPKLVVRKLLYNTKYFAMRKGYFSLKEGVRPMAAATLEADEKEAADELAAKAEEGEEVAANTKGTTNGDAMLVLDESARMEGLASPSQEVPEVESNDAVPEPVETEPMESESVATEVEPLEEAEPAPAQEEAPSPPAPKPAGDMFTNRLEAILGTDTRVRVKKPEKEG